MRLRRQHYLYLADMTRFVLAHAVDLYRATLKIKLIKYYAHLFFEVTLHRRGRDGSGSHSITMLLPSSI